MSWLAKSLANSLIPDNGSGGGGGDEDNLQAQWWRLESRSPYSHDDRRVGDGGEEEEEEGEDPTRGVKEDLSKLTKNLTRQLWGVANFLAPPPHSPEAGTIGDRPDPAAAARDDGPEEDHDTPSIARIRSDFAEIGGRFKSGISKLSSNKAVTEISKIASTFLPFGSEEDDEEYEEEVEEEEQGSERRYAVGAIGVTEEVMTFVRNISMHPETWLDFPLLSDDEESDDFDMSDAQQEHAYAVESLTPRLAALRIELCPTHMSEGCFWKIYFVLLHPRLNKHDAELLSTPQIVEARSLLQQKLQKRSETQRLITETSYRKHDDTTFRPQEHTTAAKDLYVISPSRRQEDITSYSTDFEMEKHTVSSTEIEIVDKDVIEEEIPKQSHAYKVSAYQLDEEGDDDWLKETVDIDTSATITIPLDNDEDVSFSDLEEEDDNMPPPKSAKI